MTKLQQMLTSLVAAIPAAYLAYELVMAMISHSENLSTIAYIIMGLTLLSAATAALIPIAVLVGGKRKAAAPASASAAKKSGDEIEALDDDVEVSDESGELIEAEEDLAGSSDFDLSDSSDETLAHGSEDDMSTDAIEEFDLDDEEEEKPKSKKKKR